MKQSNQQSGANDKKPLPGLDDFGTESIRQAVRRESLFHPMVLYPAAIGMLSGFAAMLYDLPMLFLGMGGLLAVGAGTSVINFFFRGQAISGKYLEKLAQKYQKERERLLETLSADLQHCAAVTGAEQYGRQGQQQFTRIDKKYQRLRELLQKKFKVGELTYGSFLGAAEQVHLSVVDNLLRIVSLIQSAEAIDPEYIAERIKDVQSLKKVTEADEREFESLRKRLELRENQLQQVNILLTENEESMTVMDETIAAIADIQTGKGLADSDLQSAMTHLKEIAGRTKLFNQRKEGDNI
jgi:hypothetical protein